MDEEDRFSASSAESERENEPDEVMEDVDEGDNDAEAEEENNEDNNDDEDEGDAEGEGDGDGDGDGDGGDGDGDAEGDGEGDADGDADGEGDGDGDGEGDADGDADDDAENDAENDAEGEAEDTADGSQNETANADESSTKQKSATPSPLSSLPLRPSVRPEALTAQLYDIVPTMAAPQSTSINALAITPNLRYWFTGGSDGYIRKYDGPGTINGKLTLTVAQRHPFVDSVSKAGILMSYWENEEPAPPGRGEQEHVLSPVYSLAVHSDALWLLSGLESGGINLQSVRHDEGKKIACLQQHSNAVSVLTLAQDEKSVLSGGWDKNIFDWDLNSGQTKRSFDGSGGQISSIELRPLGGDPVPAEADEPLPSSTMATNNGAPPVNGGLTNGVSRAGVSRVDRTASSGAGDDEASPAHESLFGGSDAGSLFGETAGEQPFGHDEDEYNTAMGMMPGHEGGMDHSADMAMAGMEMGKDPDKDHAVAPPAVGGEDAMELDIEAPEQPEVSQPQPSPGAGDSAAATSQREASQPPQSQADPTQETWTQSDAPPQGEDPLPGSQDGTQEPALKRSQSPMLLTEESSRPQHDPSQMSSTTFLSAAMDGTIRLWDRRVPNPVARIGNRPGVPPWCMSACWSPNGNMIYAGRRNGTVEEFDVRKAKRRWEPERVLRFPHGSGAVSSVKPMVNGRHLVCASHDILRLYDLRDTSALKHSTVPFLIIPGPPRAGVISSLYVDPTSRFMLSAAGTRGWEGTSTEVLIGYEINCSNES